MSPGQPSAVANFTCITAKPSESLHALVITCLRDNLQMWPTCITCPRDNLQMWPTCMTTKGELGYGPLCKMPLMSQCCHAPWDLRHKRNPAVTFTLTLCTKSSLLRHIGIETQRDPDVTLTLTLCTKSSLLWHIVVWTQRDPAVTLTLCIKSSLLWHTGIVTPRDPDVTLTLTLCVKSSPLWDIEIVTERHWGTMGLWRIEPCGIYGHVTLRADPYKG